MSEVPISAVVQKRRSIRTFISADGVGFTSPPLPELAFAKTDLSGSFEKVNGPVDLTSGGFRNSSIEHFHNLSSRTCGHITNLSRQSLTSN